MNEISLENSFSLNNDAFDILPALVDRIVDASPLLFQNYSLFFSQLVNADISFRELVGLDNEDQFRELLAHVSFPSFYLLEVVNQR